MAETETPDLSAFQRAAFGMFAYPSRPYMDALEAYVSRIVSQETDPRCVPHAALEAMGTFPPVYLAERLMTGVIRRRDLFSVEHEDDKVKAETEAAWWPVLPKLLQAYARAYAYGSVGVIFDTIRQTLQIKVPSDNGKGWRRKTLPEHTHYRTAHEVRRSELEPERQNDDVTALLYGGKRYPASRARLLLWDDEFGNFTGQGARQRAWRDYCTCLIVEQLECNYLERSVDSPRVAYAPNGPQEVGGTKVDTPTYVTQLLMALRGGGAVVFPQQVKDGQKLYQVETLDLPDREGVWTSAISRREARILIAYLGLIGHGKDMAATASKTLDGMLKEFVQDIAEWIAADLTELFAIVHAFNYDPRKVLPPECVATDVGKTSAKKMLVDILGMAGDGVSRWIDVKRALDRLQVPVLDTEREPSTPPGGRPGRDQERTSDREERREDARTDEGEDDTGDDEPDRDEQATD